MIKVDLEEGYIGIPIKGLKEIFKDGHIEFIGGEKLISKLEEIMQEIYEKENRNIFKDDNGIVHISDISYDDEVKEIINCGEIIIKNEDLIFCCICGKQIIDEDIIQELHISNGYMGYYAGYVCRKCTNHLAEGKSFKRE